MKKLLLIAALTTLSSSAFASKARMTSLGNADHLVDTQSVFDNPSHLNLMGDYVTFEAGPTTAVAASASITPGTTTYSDLALVNNPNAEGGFVRSHGDAKYMAYLGRRSAFTNAYRTMFGFTPQENPIELQYAMKGAINWGVGLNYSSSKKEAAPAQKQQSAGLRFGANADQWQAYAIVGLVGTAEGTSGGTLLTGDADGDNIIDGAEFATLAADTTAEYKGTTGFKVGGSYKMENLYFYGKYYQDGFKYTGTAAANATYNDSEITASQADLGVIDHNKIDGGQWFYGAAIQLYNNKFSRVGGESKTAATYLPFMVGIEYDTTSWMTLRASATQNVLLGTSKTEDAAAPDEANTIPQNTRVAAGIGLRFGKWVADGSWAAQSTGAVNTTNLMTNLGLTYMF